MKLHVVYDPDAALPVHFAVSPARQNDMVQAREVPLEPGAAFARLIRANLMHLRSIHDLDRPPPRKTIYPAQMELAIC